MTDKRLLEKEKELKALYEEFQKDPSLFEKKTFIENDRVLSEFGIYIKDKNLFPNGYVKFLPQDFIVEEISKDNQLYTVDHSNVMNKESIIEKSPTIYATLVKCGLSTIEAIDDLSHQLGCDKTQIQYAGIKDKDAITAQRISFRNIDPLKLSRISSPYFFLKDISPGKGVIEKGGLRANTFTILVRTEGEYDKELLQRNIDIIKKEGFYNYYYLQRFGTPRLSNFYWAITILKGNYEKTIKSYLSYGSEREIPFIKNVRQKAGENFGDWTEIKRLLEPFPAIFYNELKLVSHLEKNPSDFFGALSQIPEQITLWTYGLSSWLFNMKISSYLKEDKEPPQKLPLFLTNDFKDIDVYKDMLQELGIYPPPFENLRRFPFIQFQKREIITKEHLDIHDFKIIPEGVVLSFTLSKGDYATTFLSHLFNLLSDRVPNDINEKSIDTKNVIKENSIQNTLDYFKEVIHSKKENGFDIFKQ